MPNAFQVAAQFAKNSDVQDPAQFESQLYNEWYKDMPRAALLGVGAGAAARGLYGLLDMARARLRPPRKTLPAAIVANVPFPVEEKTADFYTDKTHIPGYYSTVFPLAGLGAYGGWKAIDSMLSAKREHEMAEDESAARGEFEQALLDSYPKPRAGAKIASEVSVGTELGMLLDRLYDMQKEAGLADAVGPYLGAYGAYAAGTGLGAAALAYHYANRNSQRHLLDAALKRRARAAALTRPTEIYGVPSPVPVQSMAAGSQAFGGDDTDQPT